MKTNQAAADTIDGYIAGFPNHIQEILQQIRATIRAAAPGAQETISYQMPTFMLNGRYLVYFAAYKKHIGFYPAPSGVEEFEAARSRYGAGKGTMRFPLDQPIPFELIRRVVTFWATKQPESVKVKK
jgi:uncharacterized protein YdhG (YjbR/CyaY superfamily)